MDIQRVFCPACNHDVQLVSTDSIPQDGHANIPDPELACLDVSGACINERCPVLALPPVVIRTRLARHGIEAHLPRLHAPCGNCERVTEMIVVGMSYCWCTECGTTSASHLWDDMEMTGLNGEELA